ncbi:MAG: LemA protein [Chlamydiales bacterium]|jgi:LemA protein
MLNKVLLGSLAVILTAVLYVGSTYNILVQQEMDIEGNWAQVETQYQRRYDLIPNLLASTKGLMQQESKVFGELANARKAYTSATSLNERIQATQEVEHAFGRLIAIVEAYPELKSQSAVLALMDEIAGTENRVSVERVRFNHSVKVFNTQIRTYPSKLIASRFGFLKKTYFTIKSKTHEVPTIEFS